MSTHDHPHDTHSHGHAHAGPTADASVREAVVNDAPAIGLVQAEVFQDTYRGRVPDDVLAEFRPEAFAKAWRLSLASPPPGAHRLLVARAGHQVVGLLATGPSQDPDGEPGWGEITLLAVHPQARRQGHGSRLFNAGVDLLREAGADTVSIWLLADDEATRAFVAASGFGPDGAYRDRATSADGDTLREVRLTATLTDDP